MKKKNYLFLLVFILLLPLKVEALGFVQISNCNALLGSTSDPESVAWMVQQALDLIKVVGPILVVVLSSIEFISVIYKGDDDAMAKAQKKLITRLILIVLLYLLPTLVKVLLDVFGLTTDSICGVK